MATVRWIGNAVDVKQVTTLTAAGTWANGETATITMGSGNKTKAMTVTLGADVATTDVATLIANAFNGASLAADQAVTPDNVTSYGEFYEVVATVSGSTVTFTSRTAGVPFTLAASETSAVGSFTGPTTSTAATGKNFWDNVGNWDTGAVPVNGDDIVFDSGSVDLKYNLTTSIQPLSVTITAAYTGKIGLPEVNESDSQRTYREYRTTKLTFTTNAITTAITVGEGDGNGSGRIRIDSGSGQTVLVTKQKPNRADKAYPALEWIGTHASNTVTVLAGDVGIANRAGEAATVATLKVGYLTQQASDSVVYCGTGVTHTNVDQSGGVLTIQAATTSFDQTGGESFVLAGAHTAMNVDGGNCRYSGTGTITTLKVSRAVFDRSRDMRAATVTNAVQMYAGANLKDPHATLTLSGGYVLNRCRIADVTVDLGVDRTYTVT